jgi:hypothetical protein
LARGFKAGKLKWFNGAYRNYHAGGGRLTYAAARARLYRVLARRAILGDRADLYASVLPEVFGDIDRMAMPY